MEINEISDTVKSQQPRLLAGYTKNQISSVLNVTLPKKNSTDNSQDFAQVETHASDDEQTAFRRSEYEGLKKERNDVLLKVKAGSLNDYSPLITDHFARIMLVEKTSGDTYFNRFYTSIPGK